MTERSKGPRLYTEQEVIDLVFDICEALKEEIVESPDCKTAGTLMGKRIRRWRLNIETNFYGDTYARSIH